MINWEISDSSDDSLSGENSSFNNLFKIDNLDIIPEQLLSKFKKLNDQISHYSLRKPKMINLEDKELIFMSHFFSLFKEVEPYYWEIIDNLAKQKFSFKFFLSSLGDYLRISNFKKSVNQLFDFYNEFKKRTTKAGAIIISNQKHFLSVKVSKSNFFSFPKGKHERGETIQETCCREVKEETGLDISNYIREDSPKITLDQTVLYIVEIDWMPNEVTQFTSPEITQVKWMPLTSISLYPDQYSRMVKNAYRQLGDIKANESETV